jgi:hypothetical protein
LPVALSAEALHPKQAVSIVLACVLRPEDITKGNQEPGAIIGKPSGRIEADGSLIIYVQKDRPDADKVSNCRRQLTSSRFMSAPIGRCL